jgi:hypothetical protein
MHRLLAVAALALWAVFAAPTASGAAPPNPDAGAASAEAGTPPASVRRGTMPPVGRVDRLTDLMIPTPVAPTSQAHSLRGDGSVWTRSQPPQPPVAPNSQPAGDSFEAVLDPGLLLQPDAHGAAGPNHLFVTTWPRYRIQDRAAPTPGGEILPNAFWSTLGVNLVGDAFDAKVVYEPYGGRFIVVACTERRGLDSALLLAVSVTSDPTGSWDYYKFEADTNNVGWAASPSIGFNKDWIVITNDLYRASNLAFMESQVWAFDKAALYAATPSAAYTLLSDSAFHVVPARVYDPSLAVIHLANVHDRSTGKLRLSTISGAVGSETLTGSVALPQTTRGAWQEAADPNSAPQDGSSIGVTTGDDRLQNLVWRNDSLWTCHTVALPAGGTISRTAVQWWQIDAQPATLGGVTQCGRIDDASGAVWYAFPSLAVNAVNDVLVGYSRFSGWTCPSGAYRTRKAADTADDLQSEVVVKAGTAAYTHGNASEFARWGETSHSVVDPINDMDFWTIQPYSTTATKWGTWWNRVDMAGDLEFEVDALSVNELARSVTLTVTRSGSAGPAQVDYAVTAEPGDTAVAGDDFTGVSGTLTWANGDSAAKTFDVPITLDRIIEGDETFTATLSNAGATGLGANDQMRVTIKNFDRGEVRFRITPSIVAESAGSVALQIERVDGNKGAVSVDYEVVGISATVGIDVEDASGTVAWADGEDGTRSFSISVLDDRQIEGDEVFEVRLVNPAGDVYLDGTPTATLQLRDVEEGALRFPAGEVSAMRSDGTVAITVERVGGSDGIVTVEYVVESAAGEPRPAVIDEDFVPARGTLTWPDGDATSRTFLVTLVDNGRTGGSPVAVQLRLERPTGNSILGTPSLAILSVASAGGGGGGGGGCAVRGTAPGLPVWHWLLALACLIAARRRITRR